MNNLSFNFAALLVLLTVVTGAIWAVDALFFAPGRAQGGQAGAQEGEGEAKPKRQPAIVEFSRSFFPVILAVLLLRSFVIEPFRIPSGSMIPTLHVGDFILVNKFAYGLRLPVTHTRILPVGEPHHGDVVVFRYPLDPSKDFIKRMVGLPGDHIVYRNKEIYINGKLMPQKYLGPYHGEGSASDVHDARAFMENLDGVKHRILRMPGRNEEPALSFTVPPHKYFVMGDNRDNSDDSRYWGFVPEKDLVGKAFLIWFSWDGQHDRVDFGRIGDTLD